MKVLPFKIPKSEKETLTIQENKGSYFYDKLHQHPEIQISLIESGVGTYIIGDCVGEFKPNDIFVIGEDLPHVFKSDPSLEKEVAMITLFFTKTAFGDHFFDLPQFEQCTPFFENGLLGMEITSNKSELAALILKLKKQQRIKQFISFMEIIDLISRSNYRRLSSLINRKKYSGDEGKRMSDIFQFTMNEFHRNIALNEIAEIANMTPNAFCRYFKQRTNKTFINFLIDIRIGNACKLLNSNKDMSITEICYKSGFNNLANFNRKFKALKSVTPSEYRKKHYKPEFDY